MACLGCSPGLIRLTSMASLLVSHLGGPQSCLSAMEPRRVRVRRWSVILFFGGCCGGAGDRWRALVSSSEMFCYLFSFVMSVITWLVLWSLWYEWDTYYHAKKKSTCCTYAHAKYILIHFYTYVIYTYRWNYFQISNFSIGFLLNKILGSLGPAANHLARSMDHLLVCISHDAVIFDNWKWLMDLRYWSYSLDAPNHLEDPLLEYIWYHL